MHLGQGGERHQPGQCDDLHELVEGGRMEHGDGDGREQHEGGRTRNETDEQA
ncbi:hypothetical protein Cme02nite_24380 [Catellatospora methionotrophica]|uniref:Uncharacterized protein n=1 Tax=Catellatospora methionotrophica TaxID=121620 RepID=A0A8J3LFE0_9ACTN|nr:hypothetical protein Cme02nite_24380 [Catellatospora methionotrophica]